MTRSPVIVWERDAMWEHKSTVLLRVQNVLDAAGSPTLINDGEC